MMSKKSGLQERIEERVWEVAHYYLTEEYTLRTLAEKLGYSKSTIHKDLSERLRDLDHMMWINCDFIMNRQKEEASYRGGQATSLRWKKIREEKREAKKIG